MKSFVDVIIYSKNRAAQLDLLLRSIKQNFVNAGRVFVLNDFDTDDHYKSYSKIWERDYGLGVSFKTQTKDTFYEVLSQAVSESTTEYILPMCDDDVFIHSTDITDVVEYLDSDTVGICFRRSPDLTNSYHTGELIANPHFTEAGNALKWAWRNGHHLRWGYPYQAGGMVYNRSFFQYMISQITFNLPNYLEYEMMQGRDKWGKEKVMCLKHSPIVNVSVNKVQSEVNNRGGRDVNYSPEELAQKFLAGQVIDLTSLQGMITVCEFIEVPLSFCQESS